MAEKQNVIQRLVGKGLYPSQMAWMLLLPFRNLYLSPAKLANRLDLKDDSIVLELGCGPGYFSPFIAKRIPKGKLYLADIQPEMLEKARSRMNRKGIKNVELSLTEKDSLPFPDNHFDKIYLVTVLGEISDPNSYAKEMFRVLKTNAIVSISEQAGDPDSLSLANVEKILLPTGLRLNRVFGKGRTYTANFIKI
ncbi:methyltransferase domain-containing protein [Leptospira montravelensis]|uniref:Methyltransferase domain-containing protein n=1 Tax=Leptospira montravelensis TaxID=2484961 RepID=A0ABY2LPS8_9LEPT|nr:class I SAM-dependent methyltransferase [Leptospira montravelensis]TGK80516.1 methyltransferase domain-containing protein [Leptospira montravelensis]TGL00694.1 methyltransferase domain-containing protein [Leptospira montravelensis]